MLSRKYQGITSSVRQKGTNAFLRSRSSLFQKLRLKCKGNLKIYDCFLPGIPVLSIFAFLWVGFLTCYLGLYNTPKVQAIETTSGDTSISLIINDGAIRDIISVFSDDTVYYSHDVDVRADNISGYSLKISAPTNLTSETGSANISGANGKIGKDLLPNTWGYSWGDATVSNDEQVYNSLLPTGTSLNCGAINSSNQLNCKKKLTFAAKFGGDVPDGHYKASVGLSLTVTPKILTSFSDLTTMQDMTAVLCATARTNDSKQLIDIRDKKTYWVTKLADNNCWMTQNLDLDLSTSQPLTSADSDVTAPWTPSQSTKTDVSSWSGAIRSYDAGEYVYTTPTSASGWTNVSSLTASTNPNFTGVISGSVYNAHYLIGNYYNWNAATAGTGANIIAADSRASDSICPKGWQLPLNGTTDAKIGKSFGNLLISYGSLNKINAGSQDIRLAPIYLFFTGRVTGGSSLTETKTNGFYWTSVTYSENEAYRLAFDANGIDPNSGFSSSRAYGNVIRCVAK